MADQNESLFRQQDDETDAAPQFTAEDVAEFSKLLLDENFEKTATIWVPFKWGAKLQPDAAKFSAEAWSAAFKGMDVNKPMFVKLMEVVDHEFPFTVGLLCSTEDGNIDFNNITTADGNKVAAILKRNGKTGKIIHASTSETIEHAISSVSDAVHDFESHIKVLSGAAFNQSAITKANQTMAQEYGEKFTKAVGELAHPISFYADSPYAQDLIDEHRRVFKGSPLSEVTGLPVHELEESMITYSGIAQRVRHNKERANNMSKLVKLEQLKFKPVRVDRPFMSGAKFSDLENLPNFSKDEIATLSGISHQSWVELKIKVVDPSILNE